MEQSSSPEMLPTSATIAVRMRELRKAKGWSAAKLAEEMTRVGVPWERLTVTKLETSRRQSVTADELVALSIVLGVPVFGLLLPEPKDASGVQVTPNVRAPWSFTLLWLVGESLLSMDHRDYVSGAGAEAVGRLGSVRRLQEALQMEANAYRQMLEWDVKGDEERARVARQVHNGSVHNIASCLLPLIQEGVHIPYVDPRVEKLIREIDYSGEQKAELAKAFDAMTLTP